jgi:hypothetical protein
VFDPRFLLRENQLLGNMGLRKMGCKIMELVQVRVQWLASVLLALGFTLELLVGQNCGKKVFLHSGRLL